jgi:hypothetical protein
MTNDDLQVDVAAELSRDPKVGSGAKYAAMCCRPACPTAWCR